MSRQPDPWRGLTDEVRALRRDLEDLRKRSAFTGTGVHPNGEQGLDSDNYEAGESGFSLRGGSGDAEFNELTLRAGIIGDDALKNLLKFEYVFGRSTGFALTTSWVMLASNERVVPAGMTRAAVSIHAGLYAVNPNGTGGSNGSGGDAWIIFCGNVSGYGSDAFPVGVSGLNGFASTFASVAYSLDVTPGQTLTFGVWGRSSYQPVAANPDNHASVSGAVTWYR